MEDEIVRLSSAVERSYYENYFVSKSSDIIGLMDAAVQKATSDFTEIARLLKAKYESI